MSTEQVTPSEQQGAAPSGPATSGCGCPSRRQTLRAAGVVGAVVVGTGSLAACGTDAGSAVGSATSAAAEAITAAEIPVGGGKVFESIQTVVTQPTAGEYKAFSSICTHQGCQVGGVADGVITCPCHGSTFDAATGQVVQGPATQPLPEKSVTLDGDGLTVT